MLAWSVAAGDASVSAAALLPPADPAATAAVYEGRRTEARAEWWGFDPTNSTAAWRVDYATTNYAAAEWRHCIRLRACANVRIAGLTLAESGGDGLYVGAGPGGEPCRDVVVRDVVCDGNHRQGISVISAENLLLDRVTLRNTGGTAPMAGIDFEPNRPNERIANCVLRDCIAEGNRGGGFLFALGQFDGSSTPIAVRMERCRAEGNDRAALIWQVSQGRPAGPPRGAAEFVGCTFASAAGPAVTIGDNPAATVRLRFVDSRIEAAGDSAAVLVRSRRSNVEPVGGVAFEGGAISVAADRPPFAWQDDGGFHGLREIAGRFRLRMGGREEDCRLDRRRLEEWIPALAAHGFAPFDCPLPRLRPVSAPLATRTAQATEWRLRGEADLVAYLEAGETPRLGIRVESVGAGPHVVPVTVTGPHGESLLHTIVRAGPENTLEWTARTGGAYRIECGTNNVVFRLRTASASRVAAASDRRSIHLFGTTGEYFLRVPAGVAHFGIRLTGSGPGEGVAASLVDPSGRIVDRRDNITEPFLLKAARPGNSGGENWMLRLERPSQVRLEDYTVMVRGIPPFLAADPAALLEPAD